MKRIEKENRKKREEELEKRNLKVIQQNIRFKDRNGSVHSISNIIHVKKNRDQIYDVDFRLKMDMY